MKVIKKDKNVEEFNIEKIAASVTNASSETEQVLTDADLKLIKKQVLDTLKALGENRETSSYEIFGVVSDTLSSLGFADTLKKYISGSFEI